jgi:spore coat polysaccharide biosynthesis predicted glycosyltransferase SpsG
MKKVSFITDWGGTTGFGHIQRTAALVDYLSRRGFTCTIVSNKQPDFLPEYFYSITVQNIPADTDLIIRDLRDSTPEIISELQNIAPVLVIDDAGTGKVSADSSIDLLPVIKKENSYNYHSNCFIYGYNFIKDLKTIKDQVLEKTVDIVIYLGLPAHHEKIKYICGLIPEDRVAVILTGKEPVVFENKAYRNFYEYESISKFLLCSKVLITHFGITLYEGYLSQCRLLTLNPTQYHYVLTEAVKNEMKITNPFLLSDSNKDILNSLISEMIDNPLVSAVEIRSLIEKVDSSLNNFYQFLSNII